MIFWFGVAVAATAEGELRNQAGDPVEGATIVAYDQRFRFTTVLTDSAGHFEFADLHPNLFRFRAVPPSSSSTPEGWLGVQTTGPTSASCNAEVFDLTDDGSLALDHWIPDGRTLRGQIFRYTHEPLAGADVSVYPAGFRETGILPRTVTTDEQGHFAAPGLSPAFGLAAEPGYLIEIQDGEVPRQFFRGAWGEAEADRVEIPMAEFEADVGPWAGLEGVRLSGTLIGAGGPVAGEVHLFAGGQGLIAIADQNGEWSAGPVEPGEVALWASAPGYARTHWGNTPGAGAPLVVAPNLEPLSGLDFQLLSEGTLTGVIVGSGDLSGMGLVAVAEDGSIGIGAGVTGDGTFTVRGLSEGVWTLEVYGANEGFVSGALFDDDGTRMRWTVVSGNATDVGRIEPPRAGTIQGTLRDDATGGPLYGAAVIAGNTETSERRLSFTGLDGTFEIAGLLPGSWTLEATFAPFCPVDMSWVPMVWPGQVNPALAGTVLLDPDEVFVWDAAMPPDGDRDLMDDRWEEFYGLDPTLDDSQGDPDQDGFTNLVEYRLGTDPSAVFVPEGCGCGAVTPTPAWSLVFAGWMFRRRR